MKILSAEQIRAWDQYTIENEPISSFELMERASLAFTYWFTQIYDSEKNVLIFCGTGNNGGDGLAIARLLHERFFNVSVFVCRMTNKETPDFRKNLEKLPHRSALLREDITAGATFLTIPRDSIVIDAILGSGLTRPIDAFWADFFQHINNSTAEIVSVDVPSGLFTDRHTEGVSIQADRVFSFEIPKLAFFMPENYRFIKSFDYQTIGLQANFLEKIDAQNIFITRNIVDSILKTRHKFSHKGTFGHALLICGSKGMAGSAMLAAKACLKAGVGLLTLHTPPINRIILQSTVPEAMCRDDVNPDIVTKIEDIKHFTTIGIGCGLGKDSLTVKAFKDLLKNYFKPIVIDADALNIISENKGMLGYLPENSILTPHPKEFERLFGITKNDFDRLELLRERAKTLKINILLKGAHTVIATTKGVCYFNSTGNAGMATGGSGDVLTGIITGLLAQGYKPFEAAILGVYLHGLAGDLAAEAVGEEALIAGDIIDNLGAAFKWLHKKSAINH